MSSVDFENIWSEKWMIIVDMIWDQMQRMEEGHTIILVKSMVVMTTQVLAKPLMNYIRFVIRVEATFCDDYCSDESYDYDEISYGGECADYVGVGSVSPIKPTPVRSNLGKIPRIGHKVTKVNKIFETRIEVLSNVCATKIDKNVCHNLFSVYFV
ncbi:hypothetical protein RND71_009766 [Anisodus tanguticus]|uniref:Uncharacterized protein n=1 Tax=Anisodus tanguticus TaxID=243964 RepID=A0AAE1SIF9_9SOLA|nr:hypothetical protein RND71_009766 [Anisodus tanguticus]